MTENQPKVSFEHAVTDWLVNNGMSPEQAAQVIAKAKEHKPLESFKNRWKDDTTSYPPMMMKVVLLGVKQVAIKWIDENLPGAWYRPLFLDSVPELKPLELLAKSI